MVHGRVQVRIQGLGAQSCGVVRKPEATSSMQEKEAFIRDKYLHKRFLAQRKPRTKIDTLLWNSIFREDIKYLTLLVKVCIVSVH